MSNRPNKDMQLARDLTEAYTIGRTEITNLDDLYAYIINNGGERPAKSTLCRWLKELEYKAEPGSQFVWRHNPGRHE